MRVGLISDVHGNALALEAVLEDLARHACDVIVCLGDVVEHGPQPRECLEAVVGLGGPRVMGNTDERMTRPVGPDPGGASVGHAREHWSKSQLTGADRALISGFQPTVTLELAPGVRLLAYHGSPASNTAQVTANLGLEALDAIFAEHEANVFAGGHTHTAFCVPYRAGLVLNPGSVGVPSRQGVPVRPTIAKYAVLEARAGGLSVTLCQAPVDPVALEASVLGSTMPFKAEWLAEWGLGAAAGE